MECRWRGCSRADGVIFTIGHSNRTLADFLALLEANGVRGLADVRSVPRSRWFPHFNGPALEKRLSIAYRHFPELCGRRDWSYSTEAIGELIDWADPHKPIAIMCSERDPAKCHRSAIAERLRERGIQVTHIA